MKKLLLIILMAISVNGYCSDTATSLTIINLYSKVFDDVSRQFHLENGNLISQSSICRIEMPYAGLDFMIDEASSTTTVIKLEITSSSNNIYINCGSTPYYESKVYFNISSHTIAEKMVEEFKKLKIEYAEIYRGGSSNSSGLSSYSSVADILARVNQLTKQYDPYTRTFYFNEDNKILIAKSSLCAVVIPMKELTSIKGEKSGSDYHVSFTCSSYNNKCIYVLCDSFNNGDKATVITVTSQFAADEIARLLGYLKNK